MREHTLYAHRLILRIARKLTLYAHRLIREDMNIIHTIIQI